MITQALLRRWYLTTVGTYYEIDEQISQLLHQAEAHW